MKSYVRYIMVLLCALLVTNGVWGQTTVSGTWDGGTLSGSYKLANNTTLKSAITVAANTTLTIDLNGMVLSVKDTAYVFIVKGTLIIKDSNPNQGHQGYLDSKGIFRWPYAEGNTPLQVNGGIIYNPYKDEATDRKGIWVSGICEIERAKIMGCYSTSIGAAVTVTSSGSFTMKAGEIRYNYSKGDNVNNRGGAIYGEPEHNNTGAIIDISNTTISDNTSLENGGAIFGYKVKLTKCTIERNTSFGYGGGVFVTNKSASAANGYLNIDGCTIGSNNATHGGGIFAETVCTINTTNGKTTIEKNTSSTAGGGIYATNKLTITGTATKSVVISKNISFTKTVFETKDGKLTATTYGQGGGIYIPAKVSDSDARNQNCTISYCDIEDNYAAVNGGGIFSGVYTSISNSNILRNRAMSTESDTYKVSPNSGRGGGFYFTGYNKDGVRVSPEFTLINTNVKENACMFYGGGGQLTTLAKLTISDGCFIDNNTCVLKGAGGLHLTSTVTFTMDGGSISHNTSLGGVGGGIHSSYTCTINLNGGVIHNNTVYGRGGGVHVNTGGNLVLNGTNITNNIAYDGEDLAYSTVIKNADGTYSWTEPVKKTNEKYPGYGGGVLINSGTCTMEKGNLSNNHADTFGGGIGLIMVESTQDYVSMMEVVKFTLNNGNVIGNTTYGNGGGVYLMKNILSELDDDVKAIYEGKKSGITTGIPQIELNGGTISNNKAKFNGGGTYQEAETQFVINNDVTMSSNIAGHKGTAGDGGAVYIAGGLTDTSKNSVSVTGGTTTLSSNQALEGNGGGIYCKGNFYVADAASIQISNNQAKNGGGFCVEDGTVSLPEGQKCEIKNNNAAAGLGGGLYVVNNSGSQKTVAFSGGTFANNEAALGGGACVNGNIILDIASSFESNVANNGGAIYMMNGVTMNFGTGIIKANKAINPIDTKSTTAYHASAVSEGQSNGTEIYTGKVNDGSNDIYGFGGGIFMDNNTTFQLTSDAINSKTFGIFNNAAACGADDVFANGYNTKIVFPAVAEMELSGFKVPNELYWVEDYPNGDENYSLGTKKKDIAKRYDEALEVGGFELGTLNSNAESTVVTYACITIGYELVFVDLVKTGLLENDDVTFTISYKTPGGDYVEFRKVIMTGKGTDTPVTKVIALPSGEWKFVESSWGWKYLEPTYYKNEKSDENKITDWPVRIAKDENKKIIVENTLNASFNQIQDFEHRKRNILRPNKVVVTP